MADVFISYAREDKARAEQVAKGLEAEGLDVFWDSEIPPGQTWADYIESKLAQCNAVIVLWSQNSTKSQWVREEARMGRDKGKLIPAMIDASQAPFGFGEVQAADLSAWDGAYTHPAWLRFIGAVRTAANAPPAPQAFAAAPPRQAERQSGWSAPPAPEEKKKGVKPLWIVGGLGALAALVAIGLVAANGGGDPAPMPAPPPAQHQAAFGGAQPAPQPAAAAQTPQQVIDAQLAQIAANMSQQGFQQITQPVTGGIAQGETVTWPAELHAGYDYRIVGVCDADCADLDLTLYDQNNNMISQDTSTDSMPIVQSQPSWTGPFSVHVLMYNCSVAPCYYALVLYGRPTQQ